jgi:hypothetical protein
MTAPQRIHVFVRAGAPPVTPGTCPACGEFLDDVGCRIEFAAAVKLDAVAQTGIAAVFTVGCRGAHDPAALVPCPACPGPSGGTGGAQA